MTNILFQLKRVVCFYKSDWIFLKQVLHLIFSSLARINQWYKVSNWYLQTGIKIAMEGAHEKKIWLRIEIAKSKNRKGYDSTIK